LFLNLNLTARQEVATAFNAWQRGELSSQLGLPSLALELQPTFGEVRAKRIAITETTRIYSEAERQKAIEDPDVVYLRWLTAADEIVCPLCGPLHGRIIGKKENGFIHPAGLYTGFPPIHPNCRCRTLEETLASSKVPLRDSFVSENKLSPSR
jgi:SPP1 gp7 family putative phage head morphogenesis protein